MMCDKKNQMDFQRQTEKTETGVLLSSLIAPAFGEMHRMILEQGGEYVLKGGRGSGKSSFISIEMWLTLLRHPDMHGVVLRRVGNTLRSSVFAQLQWAAQTLGIGPMCRFTLSPAEAVYEPTGQKILFFGMDDAGKLKSLKVPFGYPGALWFEELDQFEEEQVRSVEQSVLRGKGPFYCFKSFNPPPLEQHWANRWARSSRPGRKIHHSDYTQMPPNWLGEKFLDDAHFLERENPRAYRQEYLGIPAGLGDNVFDNIAAQKIDEREIRRFDRILSGVDWGFYPDPWEFNRVYYDAARRILYIFCELTCYKTVNRQTAQKIKELGVGPKEQITADSAEPKSVEDYREWGLFCRGAAKGPGSVGYSFHWLQGLRRIVIDPDRCPDTLKEFLEYRYDRGKDGTVLPGYPDRNNHHIDAVRYATEPVWGRRGNQ